MVAFLIKREEGLVGKQGDGQCCWLLCSLFLWVKRNEEGLTKKKDDGVVRAFLFLMRKQGDQGDGQCH